MWIKQILRTVLLPPNYFRLNMSCSVDSVCEIIRAPCLMAAAVVACVLGDADLRGLSLSRGVCRGCPGRRRPPGRTGSSPGRLCMADFLGVSCPGQDRGTSLFPCLQQRKGLFCWQPGTGTFTVAFKIFYFKRTLTKNLVWSWYTCLFWEMFSIPFSSHIRSVLSLNSPLAWNVLPDRDCNCNCWTIFELFSSKIVWIFIWNEIWEWIHMQNFKEQRCSSNTMSSALIQTWVV